MLRPGAARISRFGGLHIFMNWQWPILTDSGGFQVYSLSDLRKINEDGVTFRSHIDGAIVHLSPEKSIQVQHNLGADITMAFDECTPYPCDKSYAKKSMELTHDWLQRCQTQYSKKNNIYGYQSNLIHIIQGSVYKDLRKISTKKICS